ncbi:Protein-tyrosine-phosphatase IBR5 [Capsicum baccatum]|uniref:Protein-tyrosine-phosphatase IBR5 n=1 Tax=Capsicum baccatum TaxID=33114 RepID=A0A2G2WD29_CAPBA|nr:Protein-tyrosine-phosphatase IBR5 [Capsicum baccatum]
MRKRERENPCGICGHYHKYEEGEPCGVCGHRMADISDKSSSIQVIAFASEILPDFLFLGSYDNASRAELLKTQGISRVLNLQPEKNPAPMGNGPVRPSLFVVPSLHPVHLRELVDLKNGSGEGFS